MRFPRSQFLAGLAATLTMSLATQGLADTLPNGFEFNAHNAVNPTTEGGVTTFHILEGQCSDLEYPDGRGESDCAGGEVRSVLWTEPWTPINKPTEYAFDIRVDPALRYEGYESNFLAGLLPHTIDSALWLAWWEGNKLHNFIYHLKADTQNGITFLGTTCQPASKLGDWVSVSMRVRWTNDDKGWIQVRCDDRLIYAAEGVATTQAPHCYGSNQCEPGIVKHPSAVGMNVGAFMSGNGHTYAERGLPSQFRPIQPDGITVQLRNARVSASPAPYSVEQVELVKGLQQRLAELGCDPGPADGVAGKKTREAALNCRAFPEGQLPHTFSVMTLPTLVDLYAGEDVAALPRPLAPGELALVSVDVDVRAEEIFSDAAGADPTVYSEVLAEFRGRGTNAGTVTFALDVAGFSPERGFSGLRLIFPDDIGQEGAGLPACGASVEPWPGNKTGRAIIRIQRSGDAYTIRNADCIHAALPKAIAKQFEMVANNMVAIGVGMAAGKKIDAIRHDGMRGLWTSLATGQSTFAVEP